jgi:hypothetical protein
MEQFENDMKTLEQIEGIIEENFLEVQKAISMVKLNVDTGEAFSQAIANIEKVEKLLSTIKDEMVYHLCANKIVDATSEIDRGIEQI